MSSLKSRPIFIYVVSMLSAIGGFLFGYDTGIVSGAILLIKSDLALDDIWQELIVSMTVLFAWIFSSVAGMFTDRLGRRPVVLLASFLCFIGSVVMAMADSKGVLLVGRAIAGAGIGLASMVIPMYIAEVAPDNLRGSLVTLNNCFITGGQFVAALVAAILSYFDRELAWRLMFGIAAVPAFIQFIGFIFMPESPRWLMKKNLENEARKVLMRIRTDELIVNQEIISMRTVCMEEAVHAKQHLDVSLLEQVLKRKSLRKALIVGCSLQVVAQLSGINTVMYYSASIIQMSGIYDETLALWLAAAVASINFFCTFVGFYMVERFGRRKLTLGSLGGVVFSLIVLAFSFNLAHVYSPVINKFHNGNVSDEVCGEQLLCSSCVLSDLCGFCFEDRAPWDNGICLPVQQSDNPHFPYDPKKSATGPCSNGTLIKEKIIWSYDSCPSRYSWLSILGLGLYLFFFSPGMGPMPWTINAEIYPQWARGMCFSIATSFNWSCNLLVSLTFLTLVKHIYQHGTFWLYASFAGIGWIYFYFNLPETRGVNLDNVEELFGKPIEFK